MTDLQRAVRDLGAVRVGVATWLYAEAFDYYVGPSADMREYGAALRRGDADAYSLWCSGSGARQPTARERSKVGV